MNRLLVLPFVFLTLLSLSCSISPKAPPTKTLLKDDYSLVIEYLQKYVPVQMKKHNFTGLSIALVDDQKVVWSEGFGFADKAADTSATESTVYRAGSVSKLFTAMAVMKLKEQQKLDLDASIRASVPEFNLKTRFGSIDEITLRNILTHHAGIPSAVLDGMWTNEPESYKTVTTRLNRYYAAYPPNSEFAYSNAGYSVAGHAVENSSGMTFSDYVNSSLLSPLQMDHSNFDFDTSGEKVAKSYWNGKEVEELGLRDLPAGGLVTTVGDLSNLVKLVNANGFYKSQVFTPQSMQEMLSVQAYDSAFETDGFNGIGWLNYSGYLEGKYASVGHTGQTLAHSGSVVIVPELKLGVVLLSNSPNLTPGLEEITAKVLQLAHSVNTRTALSSVPAIEKPQKPLPGTETGFDGRYASGFWYLDIIGSNESYKVIVGGKTLTLSKNKTGNYSLRAKLLGFIPLKPPGLGDLSLFAREVSGKKMILAKRPARRTVVVATEISQQERRASWDARLGEYAITNPIATDNPFFKINSVMMAYKDGFYYLDMSTPMGVQQIPLTVINETEATFQGHGRGLGETVIIQAPGLQQAL